MDLILRRLVEGRTMQCFRVVGPGERETDRTCASVGLPIDCVYAATTRLSPE